MKRKFSIVVDYDDEREGNTHVQSTDPHAEVFHIEVSSDVAVEGNDPFSAMTHEIGHVLAGLFDFPKEMNDPRRKLLFQGPHGNFLLDNFGTDEDFRAMKASEQEAWGIAEKIAPINQISKTNSLATYPDGRPE